jgi:hypothetical protein
VRSEEATTFLETTHCPQPPAALIGSIDLSHTVSHVAGQKCDTDLQNAKHGLGFYSARMTLHEWCSMCAASALLRRHHVWSLTTTSTTHAFPECTSISFDDVEGAVRT